jgi:pimeloyl-ACP methyl ester carboxylesterase
MNGDRLTFVLVHGSWMDGSAWNGVAARLRELGHAVHTPTLAGHGPEATRAVTHAEVVASLVDFVDQQALTDFVLVGHSFGGTVIQKAAETLSNRIRRLVFWNAFVLEPGTSLGEQTPPAYQAMFEQLAEASGDGTLMLPFPLFRDAFINDADFALAREIYDGLHPEYGGLFEEKIDFPRFFTLPIAKSYLYSWDDHSLPHGDATGWYPRFANRLGLFRLVTMPGSHFALFTRPTDLAERLVEAARD